MNALIIFDVPSQHLNRLKSALINNGYYDRWKLDDNSIFHLPANSLWKPNIELRQAKIDLQNLTLQLSIPLQRLIVLSVNPWDGIPGDPA